MFFEYDFKNKFSEYKDIFFSNKKYYLIFLLLVMGCFLSTISKNNILHPKLELIFLIIVIALGFFCIGYYFAHKSNSELYKVAFVIILCFGIIASFVIPITDVSDEAEHLARAELTSRGIIIPHWNGEEKGFVTSVYISDEGEKKFISGVGYESIQSISFFDENRGKTIFETSHDIDKIDNSNYIFTSAFAQNPFYAYLPQAMGIIIAKLLDLNVIWILWLGRICNLIFYAFLISLAIKKTPVLKIPLLVVSCMPITIYQASSISIDSMVCGLGILAVSYFIFMCKTKDLENRELLVFTLLCLLLGLCKLPYLAFIFLLFFIPIENFKEKNGEWIKSLLCIAFVSIIGILWSRYTLPTLLHSWRAMYDFNSTQQIDFLLNNPRGFFDFFIQIFSSELQKLANGLFNFYNGGSGPHYTDNYGFITIILQFFLAICLFIFPEETDFDIKTKVGSFAVILLIYIGTCFIQLLTWSSVGEIHLGISIRYFIPLLALFPVIFRFKSNPIKNKDFNHYVFIFIIGFMATLILSFITKYY